MQTVDKETLQLILDGVTQTLRAEVGGFKDTIQAELKGFKDVVAERDRFICDKLSKLDKDKIQHDKRISSIERTVAYQIGKIIGISSFVGGIITFIGIMLK